MAKSELAALLSYAQRLLKKVRAPIGPDEFGCYVTNLEKDIVMLSNSGKATRIQSALDSVKGCHYALRNQPGKRNEMVVAQVQRLIFSIQDEMR
jgi:hypothetical protein